MATQQGSVSAPQLWLRGAIIWTVLILTAMALLSSAAAVRQSASRMDAAAGVTSDVPLVAIEETAAPAQVLLVAAEGSGTSAQVSTDGNAPSGSQEPDQEKLASAPEPTSTPTIAPTPSPTATPTLSPTPVPTTAPTATPSPTPVPPTPTATAAAVVAAAPTQVASTPTVAASSAEEKVSSEGGNQSTPSASNEVSSRPKAATTSRALQKGMTIVTWWHDSYSTGEADAQIAALARTNTTWVEVLTTWYQPSIHSNAVSKVPDLTPTDESLVHVFGDLRSHGMRISLKPHVDILSGDGWRGQIEPAEVDAWFQSYESFILYNARLAAANNVDEFVIGTELEKMTQPAYSARWRALVAKVRTEYHGKIVYGANWGAEANQIDWWDAVDYIGIDAYFPLSNAEAPSAAEIEQGWVSYTDPYGVTHHWRDEMKAMSTRFGRPVIFTELGYRSANGAAARPWEYSQATAVNPQLQSDLYGAAIKVFANEPWFAGVFWWGWDAVPGAGGPPEAGYTPQNKPAESTLTTMYAGIPSSTN